ALVIDREADHAVGIINGWRLFGSFAEVDRPVGQHSNETSTVGSLLDANDLHLHAYTRFAGNVANAGHVLKFLQQGALVVAIGEDVAECRHGGVIGVAFDVDI